MIKKLSGMSIAAFQYFCVATVIAQLILFSVLFFRGGFTPEKRFKIKAILSGVDTQQLRADELARLEAKVDTSDRRQAYSYVSMERQQGVEGLESRMESLRVGLSRERQRYDILRADFSERLAGQEQAAIARSREDLQKILEAMNSKLAREQLVLMMRDGGINDVVSILDSMPDNKKRKILAEFRQPGDEDRIHELLMRLRQQEQARGNVDSQGGDVGL